MLTPCPLYLCTFSGWTAISTTPLLPCTPIPHPVYPCAFSQDERVVTAISTYFNKRIEEVQWDDEDKFVDVLNKSLGA